MPRSGVVPMRRAIAEEEKKQMEAIGALDKLFACADEVIACFEESSRVRLRQKRLGCVGAERGNVQSVGRTVAAAKSRHRLHELRG